MKYTGNTFLGFINTKMPVTSEIATFVKNLARYTSLIIMLLTAWLVFVDHDVANQFSEFTYYDDSSKYIVKFFCFVQLLITLFYFILWLKLKLPLALQKYKNAQE